MDDPNSATAPTTQSRPPSPAVLRQSNAQAGHVAKAKPDPKPMRLALAAAGLASFSALLAAIVMPPGAALLPPADPQNALTPTTAPSAARRAVQYVQLSPGQTAPAGATVIDAAAPQPITVVTTLPPSTAQKPIIIKTTQSGKVIP
jgi:hypothetical protein